jgi:tRNA-specific 2-thiouridylase
VAGPKASLAQRQVPLKDLNWLGAEAFADGFRREVFVKIRSARPAVAAQLRVDGGQASIWLAAAEAAISPGQACVFYAAEGAGATVLGGGFITRS